MINMVQLLKTAVAEQASDVHLVAGSPPVLRIHGVISRIDHAPLQPQETQELCFSVITDSQKTLLEKNKFIDFSFALGNKTRFRGHVFFQRGAIGGVFRLIPAEIPDISSLGLPQNISNVTQFPYGIVLVTGPYRFRKKYNVGGFN